MSKNTQSTAWWIISLAISVVCCAILFVLFAGYMVDIKESLGISKVRFEVIDQRLNAMSSEIESLRRHNGPQQIQIFPNNPTPVPGAAAGSVPTMAPPTVKAPGTETLPMVVAPNVPTKP